VGNNLADFQGGILSTTTINSLIQAINRLGYVADVVRTTSASTTTTEIVVDTVTFTAYSGRRYKLSYTCNYNSSVANDLVQFRFRYQSGSSLSTGGTQFYTTSPNADIANRPEPICMVCDVSGIPAGQTTIGVTLQRALGSGTIAINPFNETGPKLLLEDIGAV
jgi:hypothetical protein